MRQTMSKHPDDTETFLVSFLIFVAWIVTVIIVICNEFDVISYLVIVLFLTISSVSLLFGLNQYGYCFLVLFFVAQVIGYSTAISMIIGEILSDKNDDDNLSYQVVLLIEVILLLWCTLLLLYIKLDDMDSVLQQQIDEEINFVNREYKYNDKQNELHSA